MGTTSGEPERVKVLLHDRGEDVETVWALHVRHTSRGRVVRLESVPFLHAKPTWGDQVKVVEDPTQPGVLSWDVAGRSYDETVAGLIEDGGRYAAIVDHGVGDSARFAELSRWAESTLDVMCEGAYGPRDGLPGRAYLAVPYGLGPEALMRGLGDNPLGATFTLVHPVD